MAAFREREPMHFVTLRMIAACALAAAAPYLLFGQELTVDDRLELLERSMDELGKTDDEIVEAIAELKAAIVDALPADQRIELLEKTLNEFRRLADRVESAEKRVAASDEAMIQLQDKLRQVQQQLFDQQR
jgi:chaperonin cofactor prefoldin